MCDTWNLKTEMWSLIYDLVIAQRLIFYNSYHLLQKVEVSFWTLSQMFHQNSSGKLQTIKGTIAARERVFKTNKETKA